MTTSPRFLVLVSAFASTTALGSGGSLVAAPPTTSPHTSAAATLQTGNAPGKSAAATGYALLVGSTHYENLPGYLQLKGPANDVELMRDLLHQHYGFPLGNIVILSERSAVAAGPPTHHNIEQGFAELAAKAQAGDSVVVLLSGHGIREPRSSGAKAKTFDGFEGAYLPCDIGPWDGDTQQVKNAIPGRELQGWIRPLLDKGANVWIILDACHSGTLMRERGFGGEVAREVPPETLIPKTVCQQAEATSKPGSTRGGGDEDPGQPMLAVQSPDLAVNYACLPTQTTPEGVFPIDASPSDHPKPYGLFTHTLAGILQKEGSLSYGELAREVYAAYRGMGRFGPIPLVEGRAGKKTILHEAPAAQEFLLGSRDAGGIRIMAGQLYGLTKGSVLAVYPPEGKRDRQTLMGYVEIADAGPLQGVVKPCKYKDDVPVPALDKLVPGCRCDLAFIEFDLRPLHVLLKGEAATSRLEAGLRKASEAPTSLFTLSTSPAAADVEVEEEPRNGSEEVLVKVATRGVAPGAAPPVPTFHARLDDKADAWLAETIQRIAQARSLLNLAGAAPASKTSGRKDVNVELRMYRFRSKHDENPERLPWPGTGLHLYRGDLVAFEILNRGEKAVDATLLFVDSAFGIHCYFPAEGEALDNRLQHGETKRTGLFRITADTTGREQVVLIVAEAVGQPLDFSFLAQPRIENTRGASGADAALNSPLGRLLQYAQYRSGHTRGNDPVELAGYELSLLDWQTMATGRPVDSKK